MSSKTLTKHKKQPTTRAERRAKNPVTLPTVYRPRYLDTLDARQGLTKELKRRYELLRQDSGADSYQKELLCQRAIFLAIRLETMECEAAESGELDTGVYTQAVNSLQGILSKLGLENQSKKVTKNLAEVIKSKYSNSEDED